jgi:glycine/D-amino acid oxidase-like deaminating enzyme
MGKQIVIVGGGIIGSAAAYRLQKAGAQVTLIDAGHPRATDASFGWINASFFLSEDHYRFRAAGLDAYAVLAKELALPFKTPGCLMWDLEGAAFDECRDQLAAFDYPVEEIDSAEFARLEPAVAAPPSRSLRFKSEAVADPTALADTLLAAAQSMGVQVIKGVCVSGVDWGREIIVSTDAGPILADDVLFSAGTGTAALCAQMGIALPMLNRPGYVVETQPVPSVINHVLASPIGEIRQLENGALLVPAAISHQADGADSLEHSPSDAAEATIARLQGLFPDLPLRWANVTCSSRPVPGDDLPVIGRVANGPYIAVMHSGLTLAAVAAALISNEMLEGPTNASTVQLASFRPDRFGG